MISKPLLPPDYYEKRIRVLETKLATAQAEIATLTAQLEAGQEWEDVQYNDIINVDNGLQVRVVIDANKPNDVHLHIRKRIDGEWKHMFLTTLSDNYRLQRRTATKEE